jgi:predicted RNA-binding Zn-ribbon protein involved in translation (DUF1610 family)
LSNKSGAARRTVAPPKVGQSPDVRVVTLDIETAPLEVHCWGLWDQNIGLEQIGSEWTILSFCAKWLGGETVYRDTSGRGAKKVRDDRALLNELWTILDRADIVVAQNGVAFDVKKINSRLLMRGHRPYSPIKIVDTMLIAKRHFAFTSNKLAWMSEHLTKTKKDEHHNFPGFKLWAACLKDNPKAWAEMRKYNILDVQATEELYLRLRPWMVGHPNMAAYSGIEEVLCPKCGSADVQMRGRTLTQTGEYHRYQCKACGGWARSRYTLNTLQKRQSLLSN